MQALKFSPKGLKSSEETETPLKSFCMAGNRDFLVWIKITSMSDIFSDKRKCDWQHIRTKKHHLSNDKPRLN